MPIDAANPVPPVFPRHVGMDQVPAHVPKELIRQSGLTVGPDFLASPHDFMAALHEKQPPIYYDVSPMGNMWHLIKHEDAIFGLRHPEIFSNEVRKPSGPTRSMATSTIAASTSGRTFPARVPRRALRPSRMCSWNIPRARSNICQVTACLGSR
jgi:hypothetical protein